MIVHESATVFVHETASAILINPADEVLLLRRSIDDTHRPNCVDLPGGGIENKEDPRMAAYSEMSQEIGPNFGGVYLEVVLGRSDPSKNVARRSRYFLIGKVPILRPEVILSHEHSAAWWASKEEAARTLGHQVQREAVVEIFHLDPRLAILQAA